MNSERNCTLTFIAMVKVGQLGIPDTKNLQLRHYTWVVLSVLLSFHLHFDAASPESHPKPHTHTHKTCGFLLYKRWKLHVVLVHVTSQFHVYIHNETMRKSLFSVLVVAWCHHAWLWCKTAWMLHDRSTVQLIDVTLWCSTYRLHILHNSKYM